MKHPIQFIQPRDYEYQYPAEQESITAMRLCRMLLAAVSIFALIFVSIVLFFVL